MADDDDDKIGGQVVGAMRGEVETASRAVVADFQESAKQLSLAAARTTAAKTALHRAPEVAFPANGGLAGPHASSAYRLHDLPFPDLPDFCLPRLRSLPRAAVRTLFFRPLGFQHIPPAVTLAAPRYDLALR